MKKIFLSLVFFSSGIFAASIDDAIKAHEKKDYATAMKIFKSLAMKGDTFAQTSVGNLYSTGQGVPVDHVESARWYRMAALRGDVWGQEWLGHQYRDGQGVAQNYAEARKWYQLAAKPGQGREDVLFHVGMMYLKGHGVPQDFVRAHMWFNLSAMGGSSMLADMRDDTAKQMTAAQVAEAQRMAKVCLAKKYIGCD
jgi:TPR repeat protein